MPCIANMQGIATATGSQMTTAIPTIPTNGDDLSDLLGNTARTPEATPADAQLTRIREQGIGTTPTATPYRVTCRNCSGTGQWNRPTSLGHNKCVKCGGKGYFDYKQSPAKRAQQAAYRQHRAANQAEANWQAFEAANPAEAQWLKVRADSSTFASDLRAKVIKWGSLTAGQLGAVTRIVAEDAARQQQAQQVRQQQVREAAPLDVAAIDRALRTANGNGLKRPALRLGDFIFKLAGDNSRYAGKVMVLSRTRTVSSNWGEKPEFLGHIDGGLFMAGRACTDADKAGLLIVAADPVAAAVRYGRDIGNCSCCDRVLNDPVSVARGIGPICADRFGF